MTIVRKLVSLFVMLILASLLFGVVQAAAFQSEPEPNTPIEHFIVVMQQNHTFDNYFGTYPGANGIPEGMCMPNSLSNTAGGSCVAPFEIKDHPISDLSHSDTTFAAQYRNGEMNGFVEA